MEDFSLCKEAGSGTPLSKTGGPEADRICVRGGVGGGSVPVVMVTQALGALAVNGGSGCPGVNKVTRQNQREEKQAANQVPGGQMY